MTEVKAIENPGGGSLVDHALVHVFGHSIVVITGTTITASDDGSILVTPPKVRLELQSNGQMVPVKTGPGLLFRKTGEVVPFNPVEGEAD